MAAFLLPVIYYISAGFAFLLGLFCRAVSTMTRGFARRRHIAHFWGLVAIGYREIFAGGIGV
jgi:hypothetical protein